MGEGGGGDGLLVWDGGGHLNMALVSPKLAQKTCP